MSPQDILANQLNRLCFVAVGAATTATGQPVGIQGVPLALGASVTIAAAGGTPIQLSTNVNAVGGLYTFAADVWCGMATDDAGAFPIAAVIADMDNGTNYTRYALIPAGTYRIGAIFGVANS